MANVKFPGAGIEEDLTAPNYPWVYYGVCTRAVLPLGNVDLNSL